MDCRRVESRKHRQQGVEVVQLDQLVGDLDEGFGGLHAEGMRLSLEDLSSNPFREIVETLDVANDVGSEGVFVLSSPPLLGELGRVDMIKVIKEIDQGK